MQAALHKATRTGWPFSARLVAVALSAFIAWEHKDEFIKKMRRQLWMVQRQHGKNVTVLHAL